MASPSVLTATTGTQEIRQAPITLPLAAALCEHSPPALALNPFLFGQYGALPYANYLGGLPPASPFTLPPPPMSPLCPFSPNFQLPGLPPVSPSLSLPTVALGVASDQARLFRDMQQQWQAAAGLLNQKIISAQLLESSLAASANPLTPGCLLTRSHGAMPHAEGPVDPAWELPSLGSAGHFLDQCKPCAFLHTKGCSNGFECKFCHLCDRREKKRRLKEKKSYYQALEQPTVEVADAVTPNDSGDAEIEANLVRSQSDSEARSECSTADTSDRTPASVSPAAALIEQSQPSPQGAAVDATLPEEPPNIGSAGHGIGECKPCAFFHTKGCSNGYNCQFCHQCDKYEKKRRFKSKQAQFQSMAEDGEHKIQC